MGTAARAQDKADAAEVRGLLADLSHLLLKWSWEGVVGYEAMVERVGQTYGYEDATVTMEAQSAEIRIDDGPATFVKIGIPGFPPLAYTQDLKNLLADIYEGKLTASEARAAVKRLAGREAPYGTFLNWLGVVVISISFALDIIGTWEGLLWGGLTAAATGLVFLAADRVAGFNKIAQLVGTFVSGVIVMIAYKYGWVAAAPGLLLISSTFVFLPGDSISTQAYELAEGRWSSGVDRLFYSLMTLALMATGAYLAVAVTGSAIGELFPTGASDMFPWWAAYPGHIVMTLGILLAFNMSTKQFLPVTFVMLVATAVAQLTTMAYGEVAGTFFASVVAMALSMWMARKPRAIPTFVMIVPVIFALSPGSHGLRTLETWISRETIQGVDDLTTLGGVLLAIGIGMLVGRVIGNRWRWIRNFASP